MPANSKNLSIGCGSGFWQTTSRLRFFPRFKLSVKKRTKNSKSAARGNAASAKANGISQPEDAGGEGDDPEGESSESRPNGQVSARRSSPVSDGSSANDANEGDESRESGSSREGGAARPPQLDAVFSPVEIAFFERAADMYADEYDVWEDFRRVELN